MKKIIVLSTGGTISTEFNSNAGGLVPTLNGEQLKNAACSGSFPSEIIVETRDVVKLNSSALTLQSLMEIRKAVIECDNDPDISGIVITHGTGMMEETAYFLDISLNLSKPVVMTGAQRNISQRDSDGPRNLREAIIVAADEHSAGQGVLILFNSEVFAARDVTKQHCIALQAFSSGAHGYLGAVYYPQVIYYRQMLRLEPIEFDTPEYNVDLIKFAIGADARFIDCSIACGAKGIVIEGSGCGNVNPDYYAGVKRAIENGILVGIVSKTAEGRAMAIYANEGGGASLVDAGAIMLGDLSGQKARLLLMAALSDGRSAEEAKEICKRMAM